MERKFIIYYHKSPEGKYYIGQTCQNTKERWRKGKGYNSLKFTAAIQKYGWDNFEHGILEENVLKDKIDELEAYYIEKFNSVENGYNTYKQNYSGYHFSDLWENEQVKAKMIKTLTDLRNTEEYHNEQSQRMKNLWNTEEYRQVQKDTWTDERKEKTSQASKENWLKEGYREKISKAQSEYRKKDWENPEYRKKMCKQVWCQETNQVFESIKLAAEFAGVKANTLCAALKSTTHQSGKHPETGVKLHWYYASEVGKEG